VRRDVRSCDKWSAASVARDPSTGSAIQTGSARFLAMTLGIADPEAVIRLLVALVVLLIDPSAVVLTIAASRRN